MAIEQPLFYLTGRVAAADLRTHQFKFVKLDSNGKVVAVAAATDRPIGVLQNKPNTDQEAQVMVIGVSKVQADAALTVGTLVGTSADGQADAKTVGTDTTEYVVGTVLSATGAAAELASVLINCAAPARAA